MSETRLWLPVCLQTDVAPGGLLAVTVLDQPLVIWRTAGGRWGVAHDRCPHRGTALSIGRVSGEHLVCAYHGWAFGTEGRCERIPALPQLQPTSRHALQTPALCERDGLIWVRFGQAHERLALREPVAFAGPQGPQVCRLHCGPYEVAAGAPRVMENFLDLAHFAFVHPGTLGDPAQAQIPDYQVEQDDAGLVATGCSAWQPRSSLIADGAALVSYRYEVSSPFTARLAKQPQSSQDHDESIGLYLLPIQPERTRVWFLIAMTAGDRTEAQIRAFQDAIFAQDKPILEAQRPARLPLSPVAEVSCAIDRLSLAYRSYLRSLGVGFGCV